MKKDIRYTNFILGTKEDVYHVKQIRMGRKEVALLILFKRKITTQGHIAKNHVHTPETCCFVKTVLYVKKYIYCKKKFKIILFPFKNGKISYSTLQPNRKFYL